MKDRCEICGTRLKYVTQKESCMELECQVCKKKDLLNIFCPKGHYICVDCKIEEKFNL